MEIFKLDAAHLPSTSLKGYESIIWTERYDVAGDFEITMVDDISILTVMPLGALISHTDTLEVMIVENHELSRDAEKKLTVKVTGRSFETFAENRVTAGSDLALKSYNGTANAEILSPMTSSGAATHILRYKLQPGVASVGDAIPNLIVSEAVAVQDAQISYQINRGDIYSQVLEFLKINRTGIRIARPNGAQTTLNMVVHDGADKSATVVFYAQSEDLQDAHYFKSNKNSRNYARVSANTATRLYRDRALTADVNGLSRRIMYVEASDLEGAYDPAQAGDAISGRGQAALDSHVNISIIQAKISETANPRFKVDYNVGDIIMVFGEFSVAQKMRITEHILTVDKDGIRGYPALSAV